MNTPESDEIELLLQRQFEGPVADDGFSARVMEQLPQRRRLRWPLWGGVALGGLACWLSLAEMPLLQAGWIDWIGGQFTAASAGSWLLGLGIAWLVSVWALLGDASH